MGGPVQGSEAAYPPSVSGREEPADRAEGEASGVTTAGTVEDDVLHPDRHLTGQSEKQRAVVDGAPASERSKQEQNDEFVAWFQDRGQELLIRSAQLVSGRDWEDAAAAGAMRVYEQFGKPEVRERIKSKPGYVYTIVRNKYLDYIKVPSRHNAMEQPLPEGDTKGVGGLVAAGDDPGWEVRHAVNLLDQEERELVFLRYFMGLSLSETARNMGLKRSQAERLHKTALEDLRLLLTPEEEG
jgi:RNA polymerase sigma-70 factor (ECF subfamily)